MNRDTTAIKKILVVDDSEDARSILVHHLGKSLKCHVTSSSSVDEAIAILEVEKFDCIVSDFEMPPKTALDLASHLQKSGINIPFVVFTGHTNAKEVHDKFPVKPSAIVQKLNSRVLVSILRQILERIEGKS